MPETDSSQVKDVFAEVLGHEILDFQEPETGTFNTSYRIKTDDGKHYLAQIAPPPNVPLLFYERGMMLQVPEILRQVRDQTDIPVPDVIYLDAAGRVLGHPFIILTILPGKPMSHHPPADPASFLNQLGACIRQLHSRVTSGLFGYQGPDHPMDPQATWPAAFTVMWQKLLADLGSIGAYRSKEIDDYERLLADRLGHFSRPGRASLLHMDIWEENLLTDGRRITGIIDWDRALWGDPELEFARIEKTGLLNDDFWHGYGAAPTRDDSFFVRRAFYILYEHQKHIFTYSTRDHRPDAAARHVRECHSLLRKIAQDNYRIYLSRGKPA